MCYGAVLSITNNNPKNNNQSKNDVVVAKCDHYSNQVGLLVAPIPEKGIIRMSMCNLRSMAPHRTPF